MSCPVPDQLEVDLVIYHAACADGFGAAWAAHNRLGERAEYVKCQYGDHNYLIEQDNPLNMRGKNVAIVDFSFTRPILDHMRNVANSLIVLDHHKTALSALQDFENAIFDINKSGAILTWEWFHPGVPAPLLLEYVQDRDLWRWELPQSKFINARLELEPYDFGAWHVLASDLENHFENIATEGKVIRTYIEQQAGRQARHAVQIDLLGTKTWCVNCTGKIISDVCHSLVDRKDPDIGVALGWFYDYDVRFFRCTMRSRDGGTDVSEICYKMGGGGHKTAAGFEWHHRIEDLENPEIVRKHVEEVARKREEISQKTAG